MFFAVLNIDCILTSVNRKLFLRFLALRREHRRRLLCWSAGLRLCSRGIQGRDVKCDLAELPSNLVQKVSIQLVTRNDRELTRTDIQGRRRAKINLALISYHCLEAWRQKRRQQKRCALLAVANR